ncbi:hypothetical protein BJP25_20000 [Actinokineospora bangkokensis]|uniref:Uncharacterized protein n=1 Tax=Actinokineospora bangkokensis TaxID=1193682 RepID=A0A1Q9LK50_9PSEU|nr:hypothetical protein BJP25_20000 [Actinokineospora bangkokensis]
MPPPGIDAASIDTASAITVGTATSVPVAAGKWVMRYFSAADGERFAVSLSGGTFGSCGLDSRMYNERNQQTGGSGCVGTDGWIETGPVSGAGLRSLLLYNGTGAAGTTNVTVHKVPADVNAGAQSLTGTAKVVTVANPGQNAYTTFTGAVNQRVIIQSSGASSQFGCCGMYWWLVAPDGTRVGSTKYPNDTLDTTTLTQAGTYKVYMDPGSGNTGSVTFSAWTVPADLNAGAQPLDGTAKTVSLTNPGRNAYTTFTGAVNQRVIIQSSEASSQFGCCGMYWWLVAPDGTRVGSTKYPNDTLDTTTLPQAGTYRIVVDPSSTLVGSVVLKAWTVPADLDAGTLPLDGSAKVVTVSNTGQDAFATFSGTAGQRVLLQSTASSGNLGCCGASWQLFAPDGTRLADKWINDIVDTTTLPQTGTYKIWFGLSGTNLGSTTFKGWTVPADLNAGTLPLDGSAKVVTVSNTGQDAFVTFSGTAGQRVLLQSTESSGNLGCCGASWQVFAPDGTRLADKWINDIVDTTTLPQTGTYKVWFGLSGTNLGSTTFKAWTVPADLNAGTLPLDGTAKVVTITNVGQDADVTFSGTAGQRVFLQSTDSSSNLGCCGASWQVFAPDGTRLADKWINDIVDTTTLPQTGTYKIHFGLSGTNLGSTTFKAWTVPADLNAGTLPLDGTAKTVTVANIGQDGYVTFAGTTGQRVFLQSTDSSANLGCCGASWQLFAPDGTRLADKWINDIVDTTTLPQTGTYKIHFGLSGANTGATTFKAWTVPADADAGAQALDGTAKVLTSTTPGQAAFASFPGTAGQRVIVESSGTSPAFGCCGMTWWLLAPDGTTHVGGNRWPNELIDTLELPQTGTYKVWMDPGGASTGSGTFKVYDVPADLDAGAITTGTAKTLSVSNPGRNAFATFTGSSGQRLIVQSSATSAAFGCCAMNWWVQDSAGTRVGGARWPNESLDITLPAAGSYKLYMSPNGTLVGGSTFTITQPAGLAAAPASADRATTQPERTQAAPKAEPGAQQQQSAPAKADREPRVVVQRPAEKPRADDSTQRVADLGSPNAATLVPDDRLSPAWTPDAGNLSGADWLTRRGAQAPVRDLSAPQGVTAISGHVLGLDGKPLLGIPVRVDQVRTTTDAQGRFLLAGVRANATTIVVDGYAADTGKTRYGTFRIHARVVAGQTTPLDATVWLPKLDMAHTVKLAAPTTGDTVLSTPAIPGLEVRIPAGTVVRDLDGKVVTELGITAIPLDRPPYPLPRNGIVPTYFTVQPGGATIFPQGASVVYPNYTKLPAGTTVDFWNYDPVDKQWYVYGHGKVNADASRVVPDEATKLWTLDGAMFNTGGNPKPDKPWWQDLLDKLSGDPVDLSTGLLTDAHTDLGVDDTVPISLTREYWQGDNHNREFGLNSGSDFNLFLASENQYQEVDLYSPGGGRAHYVRTSPGTGYGDAVFGAVGSPGRYTGSTIAQVNGDWVLSLRDGTKFFFPWYSRARAMQDRNGNQVTFVRSGGSNGEVTQIVSPNGRWIALEYDASARVVKATDNIGRAVSYTYDTAGRLATVTDVAGKTSTYTYDTANRITRITDARGVAYLDVVYDANGRVQRQNLADGGSYQFAYTLDAAGNITETRVTQPSGSVRRVTFDANRMVATDTEAFGTSLARTTTYVRGQDNRIDAEVDPYGRRTEYTYDASGRPTAVTELAGTAGAYTAAQTTYGPFDQPLVVTDAAGKTTTNTYDAKGNLLTSTDGAGRKATFTRTSTGQVATATSASGGVTTYTYEAGAPVSVKDPLGRVSRTFFDAAGRPVATTDPAGAVTLTKYNAQNLPVSTTDPLGGTQQLGYDANGNLTSVTDPRGKVTTYAYNGADLPVSTTDPRGKTATTTYDAAGRTTATVSEAGKRTEYTYNTLGLPTKVRFGVTSTTAQQSQVTYTYDSTDRLTALTDSAGGSVSFTYDSRDRVVTETRPTGTVGYTYDAVDRQTGTTAPGVAATTYSYDNAGALTGVARGSDAVAITRDAGGRPTTISLPGGWTQTRTYDAANQLTRIAYAQGGTAKGELTYAYDAGGRVSSVGGSLAAVRLPAARSGLVYDDANRLVTAGSTTLTYDDDGNLLNDGTTAYTWNARGRLTATSKAGLSASYTYDALGDRTSRTVGATTTKFVLDGSNAIAEQDGAGTLTASLLSVGTDQWAARTKAGVTDTVLTDAQGSVIGLGRADGTIAASQSYDPFGVPATTGDPRGSDLSYTGRQDDGTGLLHYRGRYYSPAAQRFTSEDPTGMSGGPNLFTYAANSPANYSDPSGENPVLLGCLAGGALDYAGQRLSGRKVDWGQVAGAAAAGCAFGGLGALLRGGLGAGLSGALGKLLGRAGTAANGAQNGIRANAAAGKAFEQALGLSGPRQAIPSLTGTAARRFPDGLNAATKVLSEAKNVKNLGYTNQLKDYVAYAQANGYRFDLYVRPGTTLSPSLQNAVNNGLINVIRR